MNSSNICTVCTSTGAKQCGSGTAATPANSCKDYNSTDGAFFLDTAASPVACASCAAHSISCTDATHGVCEDGYGGDDCTVDCTGVTGAATCTDGTHAATC